MFFPTINPYIAIEWIAQCHICMEFINPSRILLSSILFNDFIVLIEKLPDKLANSLQKIIDFQLDMKKLNKIKILQNCS